MSADFPSSNPFRRKALSATSSTTATNQSPSVPNHVTFQHHQQHQHHQNHQQQEKAPSENTQFERFDAPKLQTKPVKKVRVQSPPPSSPEADACSPTPVSSNNTSTFTYNENDPFDGALSDTSEDEKPVPRMRNVPVNPFSKTLETMEGGAAVAAPTSVVSPGRASLDVEAFKRLLMTGNSGLVSSPAPTTPIAATTPVVQPHQEGSGSSTDTSSLSRQSIFEPLHEAHPESPRTSHEISEPEDEHRGFTDYQGMSTSTKKKPPPPSSRHGKLIKMELGRDDPATSTGVSTPPTPNSAISQNYFNTSTTSLPSIRSQTDLNKPLPPAPTRASHEFDRESVFDKEAAGKTPEPPSPSASLRRKTPPAPPIARRHSQLVSESKLTRSESGRLSPRVEEDTPKIVETSSRPRSDSAKAPPPPPSRRHAGSIKGSSNQGPVSPTMNPGPPIPPTRMPSTRQRPPSVSSMEMSSTKRGAAPPPPPPHRHGRGSIDGQRPMLSPDPKTSGEYSRRSNDSGRRDSVASSITSPTDRPRTSSGDVLADLTALQREIDALRGQSEKHAAT